MLESLNFNEIVIMCIAFHYSQICIALFDLKSCLALDPDSDGEQ